MSQITSDTSAALKNDAETEATIKHAAQNDVRMRRYYFDNYLVLILGGALLIWLSTWLINHYTLSEHLSLPQAPLRKETSIPAPPLDTQQVAIADIWQVLPAPLASVVSQPLPDPEMSVAPALPQPSPTLVRLTADDLRRQGEAFVRQAELHTQAQQWDDAEQAYRKALAVRNELAETYSSSYSLQKDLLDTYVLIGDFERDRSQFEQAIQHYRAGLKLATTLHAKTPDNIHLRDYQSEVELRLARLYLAQHQNTEAINAYRAIADRLATATDTDTLRRACNTYQTLGGLYKQQNARQNAAWAYYSGYQCYHRAASKTRQTEDWQQAQALYFKYREQWP